MGFLLLSAAACIHSAPPRHPAAFALQIYPIMGAGYHSIHHTLYNYNYGHYTVFMDQLYHTIFSPEMEEEQAAAEKQQAAEAHAQQKQRQLEASPAGSARHPSHDGSTSPGASSETYTSDAPSISPRSVLQAASAKGLAWPNLPNKAALEPSQPVPAL